jgi:hypothetical protein
MSTSRLDEAIYVNKLLPVVCKVIKDELIEKKFILFLAFKCSR